MAKMDYWIKKVVFLSCILAWQAGSFGRDTSFRFQHLTVEDGLSASEVNAIHKDRTGFMWFGTPAGLNRYDGYKVRVYRNDPEDPSSISGNYVRAITEDMLGNLWIGTYNGLNRYDRELDRFTAFKSDPAKGNNLIFNFIHALFSCRHGYLWIGTYQGLDRLDPVRGTFTHFLHDPKNPNSPSSNRILGICEDDQGALWFCTDKGLNRMDETTGTITRFVHDPRDPSGLGSNRCTDLFKDERGHIWVATDDCGVDDFDPKTGRFTHYRNRPNDPNSLAVNQIQHLSGDGKGTIFVGTKNGGLDILNLKTRRITHCINDINDEKSLNSASIPVLYNDSNGILWIGTFNGGVNLLYRQNQGFKVVRARTGQLNNPFAMAFMEDHSGNLWVATDGGGVNFTNRKTGETRAYMHDPRNPSSLSSNAVLTVIEDRRGDIWVGTYGGGLNRLNGRRDGFIRYSSNPGDPSSLPDNTVYQIDEDRQGDLVLANNTAVTRYDRRTGSFENLSDRYGMNRVPSAKVCVRIDGRDNLWIGTYNDGICRVDRGKNALTLYQQDPEDPGSLRDNRINTIYSDSRNHVWIGTGCGLHLMDAKKGNFLVFTVRDGLPSDEVMGILEDKRGNLWLSTGGGISELVSGVLSPSQARIKNYDIRDGLQGNEFRPRSAYVSRSGELFFGGNRGFNRFYPEDIVENPFIPSVVLTGLRIFDLPMAVGAQGSPLKKQIGETDLLELSYRQSVFTLEFSALNYILSGKNRYAYKLEGFNRDWVEAGTRHEATYTNLNPGRYVFRVKASNNDGLWNEQDVSIKIRVRPPAWGTIWFKLFLLAAFAGGVFWLYRQRRNRRKLEEKLRIDEALAKERNLLRALIDNVPNYIFVKDTESRFISCNMETVRKMGIESPERIIGKTDFDIWPREYAERYFMDEQTMMRTGEPMLNREEPSLDSAGNPAWNLMTKVPLHDSRGKIIGLVGIGMDITERKRLEEALANEHNLLRALIDNVPGSIFMKDTESRFLNCNLDTLRRMGIERPEQIIGKTDFDFLPREIAERYYADEQHIMQSGKPLLNREEESMDSAGNIRWTLTTKVPLHDSRRKIIGLVGIDLDITERKKLDEMLKKE